MEAYTRERARQVLQDYIDPQYGAPFSLLCEKRQVPGVLSDPRPREAARCCCRSTSFDSVPRFGQANEPAGIKMCHYRSVTKRGSVGRVQASR